VGWILKVKYKNIIAVVLFILTAFPSIHVHSQTLINTAVWKGKNRLSLVIAVAETGYDILKLNLVSEL
jgi:hypothetical protein